MAPDRRMTSEKSVGFVCFAGQDWWYHSQAHSDFQLMRQIARDHPVLVVNSIGLRMPLPGRSTQPFRRIVRKLRSIARLMRAPVPDLPNFRVLSPLVMPFYGSPRLQILNSRLIAAQVRLACTRLGMRRPVCLVSIPTAEPVLEHLPHGTVIFNRADKLSLFAEADGPRIAALETRLLEQADHVVYASHALMEDEIAIVGDRGHFLGHGVDLDHFRRCLPIDEPDDLRAIPHPRIGFFGTLDDLVDYELLEKIARDLPDAQLVLVGSVTAPVDNLAQLPNVHLLGPRPYAEIPRYGSGFDVAIMPWVRNEWIHWCNPIKLKEYLALGLPVVSTAFPEVEWFRDVVLIGRTPEEVVDGIRSTLAIRPADTLRRRERVAGDSWSGRASALLQLTA